MIIREAQPGDWPQILPFFRAIVEDGETYAYPEGLSDDEAERLWLGQHRVVVAVDDDGRVLGSATMGPNRPGRGAHVATGSFMVDPAARAAAWAARSAAPDRLGDHVGLRGDPVQRGRRDERARGQAVAVARLPGHRHGAEGVRSRTPRPRRPPRDVASAAEAGPRALRRRPRQTAAGTGASEASTSRGDAAAHPDRAVDVLVAVRRRGRSTRSGSGRRAACRSAPKRARPPMSKLAA